MACYYPSAYRHVNYLVHGALYHWAGLVRHSNSRVEDPLAVQRRFPYNVGVRFGPASQNLSSKRCYRTHQLPNSAKAQYGCNGLRCNRMLFNPRTSVTACVSPGKWGQFSSSKTRMEPLTNRGRIISS